MTGWQEALVLVVGIVVVFGVCMFFASRDRSGGDE